MKTSALAAMATMALAAGTAALAASPAQAASTPPPVPGSFPACNVQQDPGGPCNAAAYGIGDPYSNGQENCVIAAYGELMKYRHQGYRSASCQLQNNYTDSWTLLVMYK